MAGSAIGMIPARLESSRLPRKLVLTETGKPLIQHTWEAARQAQSLSELYIATDSEEIAETCRRFGAQVCMTGPCANGTERLAKAMTLQNLSAELVVNIQGDEPEIDPNQIDQVVQLLEQRPDCEMATLANPIRSVEQVLNPSCVKVVCASDGLALYFSRSPIPYSRDRTVEQIFADIRPGQSPPWMQHIGLYAYRAAFLQAFVAMPPGKLEQLEQLEQLRALQAGARIVVLPVSSYGSGIDTPADYAAFVTRYAAKHQA
ncbi:MAG: 3-deoxy-manno-octulosonate cytidylyltransferase [Planctomycetaceae bacterium]|nr:3-deoxy-manno-octulosonate cytidylyltransferase [Planctomycetaceae bacterium]